MTQLNGYRILEEVGRGATGIVYKAVDSRNNRTVAAKAIRPEATRTVTPGGLAGLRAAKTLTHPHIATLYDVLQEKNQGGDQLFAVYEYVAGLSLETMLRRLALPEKPVLLRCLEQVAQALDYADTRGFVHRDVRPSNILITTSEPMAAKLTDFGISRIAAHEVTSGGAMMGTPFYLSPEEIQGTTADGRSDQFSLAVVVYEVLTGAKPFAADNLQGIFFQICRQPAKPAHEANGSLTPEVSAVLERALAKNPTQRFVSCSDFVETLEGALKQIPEWAAAAESAFAGTTDPGGTATWEAAMAAARPLPIPVPETQRLPSLKRRGFYDEEDEPDEPKKHSPWMLLVWMLALSAVVILLSFLWGQWDWQTAIFGHKNQAAQVTKQPNNPSANPSANRPAKTATSPEQAPPAAETPQPQTGTAPTQAAVPAPPPTAANGQAENRPTPSTQAGPATHPALRHQPSGLVPGATASIDLLSVPPGATMMIDNNNNLSCVTPCTMTLPNGRHTAAALLKGYNVGRRVFNIPEDTSVVAALTSNAGTLVLTSTPPGARIFVDGKPDGVTPSTLHLSAGRHKLVMTLGAMQHEETLEIEGGEMQSRSLRW